MTVAMAWRGWRGIGRRFFALIMRDSYGRVCLRHVSPNIRGLDSDGVNPTLSFARAFRAEGDSMVAGNSPIRRGAAAAFGVRIFIAADANYFPGHRTAFIGHRRVEGHGYHFVIRRPEDIRLCVN